MCARLCVLIKQVLFVRHYSCTWKQKLPKTLWRYASVQGLTLRKSPKKLISTTKATALDGSVGGILTKEETWISCSLIRSDTQAHTLYRISPVTNKPFNHGKKTRRFHKHAFAVPAFGVPDPVFLPDCEKHLFPFKRLSDQYLINCLLIFGSAE